MDDLDSYISPIQRIATNIQYSIEEREGEILMKAVHNVGFDVDKYELMKALAYDREQYKKGYADAMKNAVPLDKLCEWLSENSINIPCESCPNFSNDYCTAIGDMSKPCPKTADSWRQAITKWMEASE